MGSGPLLVVLLFLGPLGAAAIAFPAEHTGLLDEANSTDHVHVRSGFELVQALAAGWQEIAVTERYIRLSEEEFANVTTPIVLSKNTTVFGSPLLPEVIVQISARAKLSLGPRVTLTFLDIMLETPPKEYILQQPGLSLITASHLQEGARLVLEDVVLWGPLCFNASDRAPESSRPVPRPASEPGVQNFTSTVPQTGCTNSSSALVLQRCWADRSAWYDFALEGRYVDALGTQRPNNYTVRMLNLTLLCRRMLSSECVIASGSSSRCYLREINNGTLPDLDLGEITLVAPSSASPPPGPSGGGGDHTTVAIVLGCVLGGVALLSVVGLAVWWRHRRRAQQHRAQDKEQGDAGPGAGAAISLHLAPDGDGGGAGQVPNLADAEAAVVHVGSNGNIGDSGGAARWLRVSGNSGGKAASSAAGGGALSKGVSADMSGAGLSGHLLMSPGASAGEHATPPHSGRGMQLGPGAGPGVGKVGGSSRGTQEQPLQSSATTTSSTATHTSAGGDSARSTLMLAVPLGAGLSPVPARRLPQPPHQQLGGGGPSFRNIHVQELAAQYAPSCGSTHDRTGATADVVVAATPYQPSLVLNLEVDESGLAAMGHGGDEASAAASAAFGAYGYSSQLGAPSSLPGGGSSALPTAAAAAGAGGLHRLLNHAHALQPPHPQHDLSGATARTSGSGVLPTAVVMGSPGAVGARGSTGSGTVAGAVGAGGRAASRLAAHAAVVAGAGPQQQGAAVFRGSSTGLVDAGLGGVSGSGGWDASLVGGAGHVGSPVASNVPPSPSPSTGSGAAASVAAAGAGAAAPPGSGSTTGSGGADVVTLLPVVRGRGAFGRVTEGMWRGQRVAVKQMLGLHDGAAAGQSDLAKAFKQEVDILGRCAHPNVVKLLAASLAPPRLCLVMELCETSLERMLFGKGPEPEPLPLPKVLHIAIQICQGLAYLHPTVIHRDLKPANVLINNADSDRPTAKLTDFGLSRMRAATLPTMEPEAGTTTYLAPECFEVDNAIITHQADMYSLGVVLWTMLAAREPWKDLSIVAVAFKVSQGQRLPLDGLSAERCPPKLRRLIESLWDQDPLRRPAAAEVLKMLVMIHEQLENPGSGGLLTPGSSGLNFSSRPPSRMHTQHTQLSSAGLPHGPAPARALSSAASLLLPGAATQQAGPGTAQGQGQGQDLGQGQRVLVAAGRKPGLHGEAPAPAAEGAEANGGVQAAAEAAAAVNYAAEAGAGGGGSDVGKAAS